MHRVPARFVEGLAGGEFPTLLEKHGAALRLLNEERKQFHQHGVQGARAGAAAAQEEDEEDEDLGPRFC